MACRFCGGVAGGLTDPCPGQPWPEPSRCPQCVGKVDMTPTQVKRSAKKIAGVGRGFADIADMDEDSRIALIGEVVMRQRKTVAVFVDDESEKVERYEAKLRQRFPGIRILGRESGPVADTVTLRVAPPDGVEVN